MSTTHRLIAPGLLAFALVLAGAPSALAQTAPTAPAPSRLTLMPPGELFPAYVADPHRPTNTALLSTYLRGRLPGSSLSRIVVSTGGRLGMLRYDTATRSWQLSLDAGIDVLFDNKHRNDAIGWDGNYGMTLTTGSKGPFAFKLAWLHLSAHVGDEYAHRTGRGRINNTREEFALGMSWAPSPRWRSYVEGAHAYLMRSEDQRPWRAQTGLEYESPRWKYGKRFAAYAAADFAVAEERGWHVDRAVQAGILTRTAGRTLRLLVEYAKGRPTVSDFFQTTEMWWSFGIRID